MTPELSKRARMITTDPGYSHRYIECFKITEAVRHDLYDEAHTADAMVPRRVCILNAGCGPGRHTGWLSEHGHHVVGVDIDPALIAAAQEDHLGSTFLVDDLVELDLPTRGIETNFGIILPAGNAMGSLASSTRVGTLRRLRDHLTSEGHMVAGFGAGRGYEFIDFLKDARTAGLNPELVFST